MGAPRGAGRMGRSDVTASTNTEGTRFGCACVDRDAGICISRRYGLHYYEEHSDERGDECECLCHGWDDGEVA